MEIKVWVNEQEVTVFEGATAKDALLRYFVQNDMDLSLIHQVEVYDFWEHEIGLDACLKDNASINFTVDYENIP